MSVTNASWLNHFKSSNYVDHETSLFRNQLLAIIYGPIHSCVSWFSRQWNGKLAGNISYLPNLLTTTAKKTNEGAGCFSYYTYSTCSRLDLINVYPTAVKSNLDYIQTVYIDVRIFIQCSGFTLNFQQCMIVN